MRLIEEDTDGLFTRLSRPPAGIVRGKEGRLDRVIRRLEGDFNLRDLLESKPLHFILNGLVAVPGGDSLAHRI